MPDSFSIDIISRQVLGSQSINQISVAMISYGTTSLSARIISAMAHFHGLKIYSLEVYGPAIIHVVMLIALVGFPFLLPHVLNHILFPQGLEEVRNEDLKDYDFDGYSDMIEKINSGEPADIA
ncbi:hypothetical protein BJ878DRAFT_557692 [Calycina marina]|uniref:Uncharacterized protein n=1 Tax=Calycina marina TaxID=1763456 RepID=A0A9P8CC46_9HELO|nr:hypothetical protein BJ878DRAFT_557692 [Calycina marina]